MSKYLIPEGFPESLFGYVALTGAGDYTEDMTHEESKKTIRDPYYLYTIYKDKFALPINEYGSIIFTKNGQTITWCYGLDKIKLDPSEIDFTRRAKIDDNGNILSYSTTPSLHINGMLLYKIFVLNKNYFTKL